MVPTPTQLQVSLTDRVRFMFDDVRERLFTRDAQRNVSEELFAKTVNDEIVQAHLLSSSAHLGALADRLEGARGEIEMEPDDKATLVMIERAICTLNEKYNK